MAIQVRNSEKDERPEPPSEDSAGGTHQVRRDNNGRFTGSGNPKGRPKKAKMPEPKSISACIATLLVEPMQIKEAGVIKKVPTQLVIVKKLIQDAVAGNALDRQRALRSLKDLGGLAGANAISDYLEDMAQQNQAPSWTAALEESYQAVMAKYDDDVPGDVAD